MSTILVTGSNGFIGKNLCTALRRQGDTDVLEYGRLHSVDTLPSLVSRADIVFHLAGVNRPSDETEFTTGNVDLTRRLCRHLSATGRRIPVVFSSSRQADLDNSYGRSKRQAEDALLEYHDRTGAPVYIYRLPNVFGKWSRPRYNTVVATFCHNIGRGLPVEVHDRQNVLELGYIDDVVATFVDIARRPAHDPGRTRYEFTPVHSITVGALHDVIVSFHDGRRQSLIPDLSDPLTKYLYSTYVSFLDANGLACPADVKRDDRGWLFELVKSPRAGQVFVSRTKPGVTRGNHYHDTKIEKFCVIQGEGVIRFRHVLGDDVIEYPVSDQAIAIVDIPPGHTHSIENTGTRDMITLFWANEIFDPQRPDTYFVKVQRDETVLQKAQS